MKSAKTQPNTKRLADVFIKTNNPLRLNSALEKATYISTSATSAVYTIAICSEFDAPKTLKLFPAFQELSLQCLEANASLEFEQALLKTKPNTKTVIAGTIIKIDASRPFRGLRESRTKNSAVPLYTVPLHTM